MEKNIDCLIIGHNEINFAEYEKNIREMGIESGAFRDLNLNFIKYNNQPFTISDLFNALCREYNRKSWEDSFKPLNLAESFSAVIAYLGTYLDKRGCRFDYVNSFQDQKKELSEKLTQNNILTIAIPTTLYISPLPIIEIIQFIKQYNQTAKIIVGGPFVSTKVRVMNAVTLNYLFEFVIGADFYVNSSQGETALVAIIDALKNKRSLQDINNIYFKTGNGYRSTKIVKENNKLSENMINWDLFTENLGDFANIRTSISCPFSCAFCGFPQHAGHYQVVDVELIEKELKQLHRIGKIKKIHFIDDTFNFPKNRFKDILKMIIKNNFEFKWHSYLRCQFIDEETADLMKLSGCEGVYLGIESGDNQILKNMNKAVRVDDYLKKIELLKEKGTVTFGSFIIGFPGETDKTVRNTIDFIEKSQLDFYRTQCWFCEPVTPIWKERDRFNIKGESFEWEHHTMNSRQACDLIEEIFLSNIQSTWIPQYNFDFDGFWHLTHRGMSIGQAEGFIDVFNSGIKEKLLNPNIKEMSYENLKKLVKTINEEQSFEATKKDASLNTEAEFDF